MSRRPRLALLVAALAWTAPALAEVDSYRFMHVTIDTPWHIFLFLLIGVLSPFVLMMVLVWRSAWRKWGPGNRGSHDSPQDPP